MSAKDDYEFSTELDISSRKQDINQIKVLSSEIVETGSPGTTTSMILHK